MRCDICGNKECCGADLQPIIEQHEKDKAEIFDLAYTISLANIDDRLFDVINRIAELSKEEE